MTFCNKKEFFSNFVTTLTIILLYNYKGSYGKNIVFVMPPQPF